MKKSIIKKAALQVLNERTGTQLRLEKLAGIKENKCQKNFSKFKKTLNERELLSLEYMGNTKKLRELGLLSEGQEAPAFDIIRENITAGGMCFGNVINAGGEEGTEGSAELCGSCPCGGDCDCWDEVDGMVAPEAPIDKDFAFGRKPPIRPMPTNPDDRPIGLREAVEHFEGCTTSELLNETMNMYEKETKGGGSCMELISSNLEHLLGKVRFKNCGGCPCGGNCKCLGKTGSIAAPSVDGYSM